ncbi:MULTISPECIES: hypothetical protein [unclassified Streptomyces]|uniref:hypothetical protein n=1 Tax=unclassified Streptomyces TaxID=2593676 RepID=UPI003668609D
MRSAYRSSRSGSSELPLGVGAGHARQRLLPQPQRQRGVKGTQGGADLPRGPQFLGVTDESLLVRHEGRVSAAAQNHDDSDDDKDDDDGTQPYVHGFLFSFGERHPAVPQTAECPRQSLSARSRDSVAPL